MDRRRTVLLRHDLPDGTWHFDWLIDTADPVADPVADPTVDPINGRVLTFRSRVPIEGLAGHAGDAAARVEVERLEPHRAAYLRYEGPVRGGALGVVRRVGSGLCEVLVCRAGSIRIRLVGGRESLEWAGEPLSSGSAVWRFRRVGIEPERQMW